jgi:hypothetical protein
MGKVKVSEESESPSGALRSSLHLIKKVVHWIYKGRGDICVGFVCEERENVKERIEGILTLHFSSHSALRSGWSSRLGWLCLGSWLRRTHRANGFSWPLHFFLWSRLPPNHFLLELAGHLGRLGINLLLPGCRRPIHVILHILILLLWDKPIESFFIHIRFIYLHFFFYSFRRRISRPVGIILAPHTFYEFVCYFC